MRGPANLRAEVKSPIQAIDAKQAAKPAKRDTKADKLSSELSSLSIAEQIELMRADYEAAETSARQAAGELRRSKKEFSNINTGLG